MFQHILIPTDGSELSKMAIHEGVALAKALGARVTVITVTTPFHVFSTSPAMVTDTPAQYDKHMTALAKKYLDAGGISPPRLACRATCCTSNTNNPIKRLSTLRRVADVTRSKWPLTGDAGFPLLCSAAKPSRC